jgi:hypothetical protein
VNFKYKKLLNRIRTISPKHMLYISSQTTATATFLH